jgi:soluble lytic murein transglycosylase-like protein
MKRRLIYRHLTIASIAGIRLWAEAPQQNAPLQKPEIHAPAIAGQHARSDELIQISIDKQKAAVRIQAGEGGAAAPFFTTPWSSPASIVPPLRCEAMEEADLAPLVKEAALAQEMSTGLIRAVIRRESASLWCAVSDKGAIGLMQLMPDTAQQFGVDPYDPKQNIQAGSRYLKQLLTRYKGDTKLALAAYNAGTARVDQAGGIPAIPETTAYVAAILKEIESAGDTVSVDPKPK